MADEKKKKKKDGGVLAAAAEAVGAAVGKVAALVGVGDKPATPPKTVKIPKLAKKNKSRLPRKQKKALQKAAASADKK
jgi:predicted trehalose synthase